MSQLNKQPKQFDFFVYEKNQINLKVTKKKNVLDSFFSVFCFFILFFGVIGIGASMYGKQEEITKIMSSEDQRIAKNMTEFIKKDSLNEFVVKNYNECSKNIRGSAEMIENQCNIYVLHVAKRESKDMQSDTVKIYESLEQFKNLSKYSPEATYKLNTLFTDLGLPHIPKG